MHIHEHQAKGLFKKHNIKVPEFIVVSNSNETESACEKLGGSIWVVKAQVHAGGRGKVEALLYAAMCRMQLMLVKN